jgi:hypothetical protein
MSLNREVAKSLDLHHDSVTTRRVEGRVAWLDIHAYDGLLLHTVTCKTTKRGGLVKGSVRKATY